MSPSTPDIPGYRVLRPLGRGGMSTVYLALQESVQREVALKIMAGVLLGDEEFSHRFLREARIAASLRHPNVVHVYDVGQHGEQHYIAMEHLPGGPVLARRGPRRDFGFALRAVREIASALDYAHRRGVVHRDIKPDNILLREDGSAVLTDFGIARAGDSQRMTRTGAIIGTPHYMSPEQARGQALDGRSDLYSLGVVFYQLLVGEVPYQADDSVAVGIMHITAPLPRLRSGLSELQPLFDRLLAKEPVDRFQTGVELAAALEPFASRHFDLPEPRSSRERNGPAGPAAATVVTVDPGDAGGPRLGSLEGVDVARGPRRRALRAVAAPARGWRGLWLLLAVLTLGLALGAFWLQGGFTAEWSGSERAARLAEAEAAFMAGRLQQDGAGAGAAEIYAAVLAAEPDHEAAREGMRRVAQALLEQAGRAVEEGRVAEARSLIERARELGADGSRISSLQLALASADAGETQLLALSRLLDEASLALADGRIETPETGAIALYGRALELDPGNALARAGLRQALAPMLNRAEQAIEAGDFPSAERQLAQVSQLVPSHLELPDLRGRLAEARSTRAEELRGLLNAARERERLGQLTLPVGASARDAYTAVLNLQPDHPEAQAGLRRLGQSLLRRAEAASADFDFLTAETALDEAARLQPPPSGLAAAKQRMEESRSRYEALPREGVADAARIDALLAQAEVALAAGRLMQPPGESAYDALRTVLALQPRQPRARQLLAELPAEADRRFEQAMRASQLEVALRYVEALSVLAPASAEFAANRQRLAGAYAGRAEERLGRGELTQALRALDRAAELEPNLRELPALRARLEQAGG
ncbi:MAG: protein kinase [Aquimonas sp.]|nr:protein kinase [Aquimonas sp.]